MTGDANSDINRDKQIELEKQAQSKRKLKTLAQMGGIVIVGLALFFGIQGLTDRPAKEVTDHTQTASVEAQEEVIDTDKAREDFKEALMEFEQNLQSYLDNEGLKHWAKKETTQLLTDKETLLASYAQGKYTTALNQLNTLSEQLQTLVGSWDDAFNQKLADAQDAFDLDRINLVKFALQKAFDIKPEAQRAKALQGRIDAYADVQQHMSEYKVGVAENDLEKQVQALSSALTLDPNRQDLLPLLDEAKVALSDQYLNDTLAIAEQAITNKDYALAERAYVGAQQLAPGDAAVQNLRTKLNVINKQKSLDDALLRARSFADDEDWEQVGAFSSQMLSAFPGNATLVDLQQQSSAILSAQRGLQGFLQRPQRLTDEGIRENAKAALKSAVPYMAKSSSLAGDIKSLGKLLRDMESTIDLTVTSDNRTHIVVKGKGIIGKTKTKTVALTPGTYTLEAYREGYRSKMVNVTLSPSAGPQEVHLVCDQKI